MRAKQHGKFFEWSTDFAAKVFCVLLFTLPFSLMAMINFSDNSKWNLIFDGICIGWIGCGVWTRCASRKKQESNR